MSDKKTHSPLPWIARMRGSDGRGIVRQTKTNVLIATTENIDDAERLVDAFNAHYELVEALEAAVEAFEIEVPVNAEPLPQMRAALTKARGEQS